MAPEKTHGWKRRRLSSFPRFSCICFISFFILYQFIVARLLQSLQFLVNLDTRPGIDSSILFLTVVQDVTFPIRQSLVLTDALAKKVGIELLEAQVLNTYLPNMILNVDKKG